MRQIAVYTALEGAETMKNLSIMIKPASSLCNMRCVYCFYADVAHQRDIASYGLISDDTLETMLRAIFADLKRGDHLNLAFQGGEPTLAGLNFFCSVIRKVSALNQGVHVHYALQTNGLLWQRQCLRAGRTLPASVGGRGGRQCLPLRFLLSGRISYGILRRPDIGGTVRSFCPISQQGSKDRCALSILPIRASMRRRLQKNARNGMLCS